MAEKRAPRVLVVANDEANRFAVVRILRTAGFETSEASSGRQAIELARTGPDVVVLDANLPDVNDFDVVPDSRRDPGTARILEEQRAAATAEWQATFDAISDTVCVVDARGAVTRANRAAIDGLAARRGDVVGQPLPELLRAAFPGVDAAAIERAVTSKDATVVECQASDHWLRIAVDPMRLGTIYEGRTVCVITDITARKSIERERATLLNATEAARFEAESANRTKSDFLATMSHEIRTPINAILGYSQILDMGLAGSISDDQRRQIDRLRRSASHLLTLVTELLDLAKIESGRMRVDARQVFVDDVVEDALAIARPQAIARAITIEVAGSTPQRLAFVGDTGRARQVLVNVLANAVKFSEPGSQIQLRSTVREAADGLRVPSGRPYVAIEIRDSGIGISEERQAEIFEAFVQGQSGPTRLWGGSGVGLAISRRLTRLMGGDITVESKIGAGAVFTVWLPSAEDQYSMATAEIPALTRRTAPYDSALLSQMGRVLGNEAINVATALAVRLRSDARFRIPPGVSDAQLIDHFPAYATAVGLALIAIAEAGIEASGQLNDGNAIRQEVAERHGAQRRRLGWTESAVSAEYDIAGEEIAATLKARLHESDALDGALELVERLLEQGRAVTLRSFREAVTTND